MAAGRCCSQVHLFVRRCNLYAEMMKWRMQTCRHKLNRCTQGTRAHRSIQAASSAPHFGPRCRQQAHRHSTNLHQPTSSTRRNGATRTTTPRVSILGKMRVTCAAPICAATPRGFEFTHQGSLGLACAIVQDARCVKLRPTNHDPRTYGTYCH